MRLWHKDLIQYLPRQQLLGQWRECCLIAKNISETGSPNHILANRIMDYPIRHFIAYTSLVRQEMLDRGYKCGWNKFIKYFESILTFAIDKTDIFSDWHNDRYLMQCYYNLQEKHDCGGITQQEWIQINRFIKVHCKI